MSVVLDVQFGGFGGVVGCVVRVSLRGVGVVSGCLVITSLVMPGGFAMVHRRVLVVFRCFVMVLCCLSRHDRPPLKLVECAYGSTR